MIPLGQTPFSSENPTVAEAIGLALPHVLENRYGTWREWVLGMTVVLGDGMIAKSGCRAVKSVAGYDAHKLFVGSRGAFGVIVEVTLRLYPLEDHRHELPHQRPQDAWICRLLKSDFERICTEARNRTVLADPETATLWGKGELPKLPPDSWMVGPNNSPKNSGSRDEAIWLQRAKALLDPMGKLNPGQLEAFL
jgi:FAD/FMN-containing dehydrogenase